MGTLELAADLPVNPEVSVWRTLEGDDTYYHLVIGGENHGEFDIFDGGQFVEVYWIEKEKELSQLGLLELSYAGIAKYLRTELMVEAVGDPEGNLI